MNKIRVIKKALYDNIPMGDNPNDLDTSYKTFDIYWNMNSEQIMNCGMYERYLEQDETDEVDDDRRNELIEQQNYEIEEKFYNLIEELEWLPNPLTIYRAIDVDNVETFIKNGLDRNLGICWTWDIEAVDTYYGQGLNYTIILVADVDRSSIDWDTTIELNMNLDLFEEKEIRLKESANVLLKSVIHDDKNIPINKTLVAKKYIKKSMPHVETNDNTSIDLLIETIPKNKRVGYLEDYINDVFDIDGYYFFNLPSDEQERVFNYYESLKQSRFSKMNNIKIIKKSLLMSNGFMQLWRNPEKYRKFINTYKNRIDELSLKYKNKSKAKIIQLVDREFKDKYYLNDFDFDAIQSDYNKLLSNVPLSNDDNVSNDIVDNNEQNNSTQELDLSEHVDRIDNEKIETQEDTQQEQIEDDSSPFYDLQSVKYKKLDAGDVIYIDDELWCVTKKNYKKCWVQNLYNAKVKTFRPKSSTDTIEILTDDALDSVIDDFRKEELTDKLPKILIKQYADRL